MCCGDARVSAEAYVPHQELDDMGLVHVEVDRVVCDLRVVFLSVVEHELLGDPVAVHGATLGLEFLRNRGNGGGAFVRPVRWKPSSEHI